MKMYLNNFGWIEDNRSPEEEPVHQGEFQLKQWFRSKGHEVIDVSDNRQFFEPDIDLLVKHSGVEEPAVAIEVKYDTRINQTGNLFIEYHHDSITKGSQAGWFYKCKAGLFFYMNAQKQEYYVFKYDKLKEYINWNNWKYRKVQVPDIDNYGVYGTSFGWLVPLEELKEKVDYQILRLKQ